MCPLFSKNQFNSNADANHWNDDDLVAATRVGSERALNERWSRHYERTCEVVAEIIRSREGLQVILQRTYGRLLLHLVSFSGESQLSTWLTQIAINSGLCFLGNGEAARKMSSASPKPANPDTH